MKYPYPKTTEHDPLMRPKRPKPPDSPLSPAATSATLSERPATPVPVPGVEREQVPDGGASYLGFKYPVSPEMIAHEQGAERRRVDALAADPSPAVAMPAQRAMASGQRRADGMAMARGDRPDATRYSPAQRAAAGAERFDYSGVLSPAQGALLRSFRPSGPVDLGDAGYGPDRPASPANLARAAEAQRDIDATRGTARSPEAQAAMFEQARERARASPADTGNTRVNALVDQGLDVATARRQVRSDIRRASADQRKDRVQGRLTELREQQDRQDDPLGIGMSADEVERALASEQGGAMIRTLLINRQRDGDSARATQTAQRGQDISAATALALEGSRADTALRLNAPAGRAEGVDIGMQGKSVSLDVSGLGPDGFGGEGDFMRLAQENAPAALQLQERIEQAIFETVPPAMRNQLRPIPPGPHDTPEEHQKWRAYRKRYLDILRGAGWQNVPE